MNRKELLRWTVVIAFGGFALYQFASCVPVLFRSVANGDWSWTIFTLILTTVIIGVPAAISIFAYRREYRHLAVVFCAVAALGILAALISVPDRLGIYEFLRRHEDAFPSLVIIALPVSLLCLLGPFYAAAWFFRFLLRVAARHISPHAPNTELFNGVQPPK